MVSPSQYNRHLQQVVSNHNRQVQAANRKAIDDHNRQVRAINEHNRKINAANRTTARRVDDYNRRADAHNKSVVSSLNRSLTSRPSASLTEQDRALVGRVQDAIVYDDREFDVFLSYAKIDGHETASELCKELEAIGLRVWFDEVSLRPGQSQSRQMDLGLRKARSGIVVLTAAYLTGRFWTERELGVLLGKATLIPVLHRVTFDDVKEYSGILPDLVGFETCRDSPEDIASKVAQAVLPPSPN